MKIQTRTLGAVEATPESFVTLPEGLIGYDDQREFALVAYGGAGPLHANAVAKLMGSFPVIVPPALEAAETNATPPGSVSTIVTSFALAGPPLVAVISRS